MTSSDEELNKAFITLQQHFKHCIVIVANEDEDGDYLASTRIEAPTDFISQVFVTALMQMQEITHVRDN